MAATSEPRSATTLLARWGISATLPSAHLVNVVRHSPLIDGDLWVPAILVQVVKVLPHAACSVVEVCRMARMHICRAMPCMRGLSSHACMVSPHMHAWFLLTCMHGLSSHAAASTTSLSLSKQHACLSASPVFGKWHMWPSLTGLTACTSRMNACLVQRPSALSQHLLQAMQGRSCSQQQTDHGVQ